MASRYEEVPVVMDAARKFAREMGRKVYVFMEPGEGGGWILMPDGLWTQHKEVRVT